MTFAFMSSLTYFILRLVDNVWSRFACLPLIIVFSSVCLYSLNPCHNIKATATCLNACIEDLTSLPKLYHISYSIALFGSPHTHVLELYSTLHKNMETNRTWAYMVFTKMWSYYIEYRIVSSPCTGTLYNFGLLVNTQLPIVVILYLAELDLTT